VTKKNSDNRRWYVLYTRSRQEKKVRERFQVEEIECYLPLERKLRIWSDRKKWIEEPIFRSYIFVRVDVGNYHEYLKVLKTEGVVHFVRIEKKPVPVADSLIEAIRKYEASGEYISEEEEAQLKVGDTVEVVRGPMKGLIGTLVSIGKKRKVRIMVEAVQQAVYLNIRKSFLRKIPEPEVERKG